MKRTLLLAAVIAAIAAPALAQIPSTTAAAPAPSEPGLTAATATNDVFEIDAAARKARKSLVLVEWTYEDANNSPREEVGQGIVIGPQTVLVWGGLISESIPTDYIKSIKIRQPGKTPATMKATFLGRTRNRLFAYVKAEKALDAPALDIRKSSGVKLGQKVFSVAMLDKAGGYETFIGTSDVRTVFTRTYTLAGVASSSLTRANSPVFDAATGDVVGITAPSSGEDFYLRDPAAGRAGLPEVRRVQLYDENQASSFLPWSEIQSYLAEVPTKPFDMPRPWAGIGGLTGLEESVRELYKVDSVSGVTIGSLIPGEAAEKAGMQPRDIILTVNGQPFSDSPVPEIMRAHFQREIEKHKVGDKLTFGVMRDGKRMDIAVKLDASPKTGAEFPHVFDAKVGLVTRDLSFLDLYARKLGSDTKGVMVAMIKNGAPASLGTTPMRAGLIITKINDTPVENQKQFAATLKKETDDPEKKEIVFVALQSDGESKVFRVELTK